MISVIIPVYNSQATLERCINSVKNQTFTDWECVIVNDASTDSSWAEIDRLTDGDGRFCLVDCETNQGFGLARNAGMMYARGDKLFFLDSDDYIDKDALEFLDKTAGAHPDAGVIFTPKYNHYDKDIVLLSYIEPLGLLRASDEVVFGGPKCDLGYSTGQLYILKNLACKPAFSKVRIFEDMLFNMEQLMAGTTYLTTDHHLYHYIRHAGSLLDTPLSEQDIDVMKNILASHIKKHKPTTEIQTRFTSFLENALKGRKRL